jgi:hypothetical protein
MSGIPFEAVSAVSFVVVLMLIGFVYVLGTIWG